MASSDIFKGVSDIGYQTESEIVMTNLIYFLDWSFVNIGGYFNVSIPTSGAYGGNNHVLRPVGDPRYTDGQVWEGFRTNWAWQSGVSQPTQPIQVSGVYVDGALQLLSGGTFHIDYPNGQIVFDSAISTTSVVTAEFSPKWINIYDADENSLFRKFQTHSFRSDNSTFSSSSGDYSELAETRIQLPAVFIEQVDGDYQPYQLGGGQWNRNDYIFHVFAEDVSLVRRISDILGKQNFKTIELFSPDLVAQSGTFPLDENGSIADGAQTYPDIVKLYDDGGYRWGDHKLYFRDARKQRIDKIHQNLYHRPVRMTTELILWDI